MLHNEGQGQKVGNKQLDSANAPICQPSLPNLSAYRFNGRARLRRAVTSLQESNYGSTESRPPVRCADHAIVNCINLSPTKTCNKTPHFLIQTHSKSFQPIQTHSRYFFSALSASSCSKCPLHFMLASVAGLLFPFFMQWVEIDFISPRPASPPGRCLAPATFRCFPTN
jgi:hypothetical protein